MDVINMNNLPEWAADIWFEQALIKGKIEIITLRKAVCLETRRCMVSQLVADFLFNNK